MYNISHKHYNIITKCSKPQTVPSENIMLYVVVQARGRERRSRWRPQPLKRRKMPVGMHSVIELGSEKTGHNACA